MRYSILKVRISGGIDRFLLQNRKKVMGEIVKVMF